MRLALECLQFGNKWRITLNIIDNLPGALRPYPDRIGTIDRP
jgi:hypothetical protein